jgi:hypothetical protein
MYCNRVYLPVRNHARLGEGEFFDCVPTCPRGADTKGRGVGTSLRMTAYFCALLGREGGTESDSRMEGGRGNLKARVGKSEDPPLRMRQGRGTRKCQGNMEA